MARVNVDQQALTDARFGRLAQLRGWADADHARGKMLLVWNETIHRGPVLQVWLVEHHLGAGSAGDLLESQLATLVSVAGEVAGVPAGGTLIRIKGCAGRTDYQEKLVTAAKAGGKARAASAQRSAGRFTSQAHQPPAGDDTSALTPALPLPLPLPLPLAHSEKNSAAPSAGGTKPRKPKPSEPTADERAAALRILAKLSERNGVRYSGTTDHIGLITRHLRNGIEEMHLRYVIAYCAAELEWATKPEMAAYLRPETLFGPKTLSKYLDPALTWVSKLPDDNQPSVGAA